jgi:amidophosphoribosyltransferase
MCEKSMNEKSPKNYVKDLYSLYSYEEVSKSITELVRPKNFNSDLEIIYQKIDDLNKACPKNLGDWYFTGDYPTFGGNKVANRAFMNYCDGILSRAY